MQPELYLSNLQAKFAKFNSYSLVFATFFLILQENFLVEKVPFMLFYSCKLIYKTLTIRSKFARQNNLKDILFLWLVCFGKKTIIDLFYYQINYLRYARYFLILLVFDGLLRLSEHFGKTAGDILTVRPVKTFLVLSNGISDAISLENLLWRNQLEGWFFDAAIFYYVILDPLLYAVFAKLLHGQNLKINFPACQKNLNFGVFLCISHYLASLERYSHLLELRKLIHFNTSNVMTPAVGMRLLNCSSYILFGILTILTDRNVKPKLFKYEAKSPLQRFYHWRGEDITRETFSSLQKKFFFAMENEAALVQEEGCADDDKKNN